jgi:hypothetical protein
VVRYPKAEGSFCDLPIAKYKMDPTKGITKTTSSQTILLFPLNSLFNMSTIAYKNNPSIAKTKIRGMKLSGPELPLKPGINSLLDTMFIDRGFLKKPH